MSPKIKARTPKKPKNKLKPMKRNCYYKSKKSGSIWKRKSARIWSLIDNLNSPEINCSINRIIKMISRPKNIKTRYKSSKTDLNNNNNDNNNNRTTSVQISPIIRSTRAVSKRLYINKKKRFSQWNLKSQIWKICAKIKIKK